MILQTLSTHHHSPRHTLVSYVEMIITTVLIAYHDSRLSMRQNRATIKTIVIIFGKGYPQKDRNKAKTRQNRARDWKERGKPKPKAYAS
ncbi:hypothetical protein Tco_0900117 [Tanacetum coccineum]